MGFIDGESSRDEQSKGGCLPSVYDADCLPVSLARMRMRILFFLSNSRYLLLYLQASTRSSFQSLRIQTQRPPQQSGLPVILHLPTLTRMSTVITLEEETFSLEGFQLSYEEEVKKVMQAPILQFQLRILKRTSRKQKEERLPIKILNLQSNRKI